jgi:hypothetical protein
MDSGRFNEGNEHMSNEQTVRDALKVSETFWIPEDGCHGARIKSDQELIDALGIDPDMSVSELQRRLRIAERVLEADNDGGSGEFLAWLTREDDR